MKTLILALLLFLFPASAISQGPPNYFYTWIRGKTNEITVTPTPYGVLLGISTNYAKTNLNFFWITNASYLTNWWKINTNYVPVWAQNASNAVVATNYLPLAGGTETGPVLTTDTNAINGPANDQFPAAGWVRSLFASGRHYYSTGVATNSGFDSATYLFNTNIPAYGSRTYTAPTNGQYIGSVITSNTFLEVSGPMHVNAYLERTGGLGSPSVTVHPELYLTYDRTNLFGDFESANQAITTGTNLYQFVVSFPTVSATNTTGFYVVRRFKIGTATGAAHPNVVFHYGTNYPSHISFNSPSISLGGWPTNWPFEALTNSSYLTNWIKVNTNLLTISVENIAAMRALVVAHTNLFVRVKGHTVNGDGGGGTFQLMMDDGTPTNTGTIFNITGTPSLIGKRIYEGSLRPEWFGCFAGSNATANSAAILAMVNWARPFGYPIEFGAGTYSFVGNLPFQQSVVVTNLDFHGMRVMGMGRSSIIRTTPGVGDSADVFQLNGVKNLSFENLAITSVNGAFASSGANAFSITGGGENITIKDCYIFDLPYIDLSPTPNTDGGQGIGLQQTGASGLPYSNIKILNNTISNGSYGVLIQSSSAASATNPPQGVLIAGNHIVNCWRGIDVECSGVAANTPRIAKMSGIISGNEMKDCQQGMLLGGVTGWNIEGNNISSSIQGVPAFVSSSTNKLGAYILSVHDVLFSNNKVYETNCLFYAFVSGGYEGFANTPCDRIILSGNVFSGNAEGYGVETTTTAAYGYTTNSAFVGNVFLGCATNYNPILKTNNLLVIDSTDSSMFPSNIVTYGRVGVMEALPDKTLTLPNTGAIGWEYGIGTHTSYHTVEGGGVSPMAFKVSSFSANDPIFTFSGLSADPRVTIYNGGAVVIGTNGPGAFRLFVDGTIGGTNVTTGHNPGHTHDQSSVTLFTNLTYGIMPMGLNSSNLANTTVYYTNNSIAMGTTNPHASIDLTLPNPVIRLKVTGVVVADQNTYELRNVSQVGNTYLLFQTVNDANSVYTEKLRLWQSGGLQLGDSFAADPGAGNMTIDGTNTAAAFYGYRVTSGIDPGHTHTWAQNSTNSIYASGAQGFFILYDVAGTSELLYRIGTTNRWMLQRAGPETGGNAGGDLTLYRYDDAGNFLGTVAVFNRQTGSVTFENSVYATTIVVTNLIGNATKATNADMATVSSYVAGLTNLTAGYLPVAASSTSLSDSPVYSTGGNVAIGTTNISGMFQVTNGVANFTFSKGFSSVTPTLAVINTGGSGKAGALLAGTVGSAFAFDNAGSFNIQAEPHTNFTGNLLGGGLTPFRVEGPTGLSVAINYTASDPTLGSVTGNNFLISGSDAAWGMFAGVNNNTGLGWIQNMRRAQATAYALALQPVGGNLVVGATAPTSGYRLDVSGSVVIRTNLMVSNQVTIASLSGTLTATSGVVSATTGMLPNSISGNAATATLATNANLAAQATHATNSDYATGANGYFFMNDLGGTSEIIYRVGSAYRWLIQRAGTESGGNTGGDLTFYRYNDAGDYLGTELVLNRETGAATFGGTVSGGNITSGVDPGHTHTIYSPTNHGHPTNQPASLNLTNWSGVATGDVAFVSQLHAAVTLDGNMNDTFTLTGQQLSFKAQDDHKFLRGPIDSAPIPPTWGVIVASDLPQHNHAGADVTNSVANSTNAVYAANAGGLSATNATIPSELTFNGGALTWTLTTDGSTVAVFAFDGIHAGILDATNGFKYAGTATNGHVLVGNGTAFVPRLLTPADVSGVLAGVTNAGGTHTLIASSNAPVISLFSVSASGAITITNQGGTNLNFHAVGGSGGIGVTNLTPTRVPYAVSSTNLADTSMVYDSTNDSIAFGNSVTATGQNSASFGASSDVTADYGFAFGVGLQVNSYLSTAVGAYNAGGGTAGSWVPTDPLFEVGNGAATEPAAPHNAFTVFKNGNATVDGSLTTTSVYINDGSEIREGLTVSQQVMVPGGTTNLMVFRGGILVSNIANYHQ